MEDIGLFPLGMVLLPHERIPLHIFEERYKELIEECIETKTPFGLILAEDDDQADIGTLALVREVTRRFPDGRLNIVIEGTLRFRVLEQTGGRSFATATVEELPGVTAEATVDEVDALLAAFAELAAAAEAEAPTVSTDESDLSFRVAALVDLENAPRQALLELESEQERTRHLTRLFSELARNIGRQREVRDRAESNGRVEPRD
jgi:Lon protease-like protein